MNRPRAVECPICGREFMKHSLKFHLKQCRELYRKWDGFKAMPVARNAALLHSGALLEVEQFSRDYISMLAADRELTAGGANAGGAAAPEGGLMAQANSYLSVPGEAGDGDGVRLPCSSCARSFRPDSLAR
jgi:hypothetical protein